MRRWVPPGAVPFRDPSATMEVRSPDVELQQAAAMGQALRRQNEAPAGAQRWGFSQPLALGPAPSQATQFVNFVSLGPWREPRALALAMDTGPLPLSSTPPLPQFEFQTVENIGDSSLVRTWSILPRVLYNRGLQVFARRLGEVSPSPSGSSFAVSIWATPWEGTAPVVIREDNYTLGIGVAQAPITPPPAEATHVMVGRGTVSSITMTLRVTPRGGAPQDFQLNSTGATAPVPQAIPLPWMATGYTLIRSATAAGDTYAVWWLRS